MFNRFTGTVMLLVFLATSTAALADDWPQWRGPNRDGISAEKGLLKQWPRNGPPGLWEGKGIGMGYSSVAVVDGKVYTMGQRGDGQYVFALDEKTGKGIWATKFAPSYKQGRGDGPRGTTTVDGDLLYGLGGEGTLFCADTATGKIRWKKNLKTDFGGSMRSGWGYSESPLVDGDKVICTPGARDATLLALNKKTGEVIWKAATSKADKAEYSSVVVSQAAKVRQYVALVENGVIGVSAETGKLLWRYDKLGPNTANVPTPIVFGDYIFAAAGYGKGAALLRVSGSANRMRVQEKYYSSALKNKHGGVIRVGKIVYGDSDDKGQPWAASFETGKVGWKRAREGSGSGSATMTYAEGRLYIRFQNGWMSLVNATARKYTIISEFKIPDGLSMSWPRPVIANGRLYLRGKDKLLCYNIKAR